MTFPTQPGLPIENPFAGLRPELEGDTWARPAPDEPWSPPRTVCPDCRDLVSVHLPRGGCMAVRSDNSLCHCPRRRKASGTNAMRELERRRPADAPHQEPSTG